MRTEELSLAARWSGITSPAIDFWLQKLSPTWSSRERLAEVVRVEDECPGVVTLTLRPNRRWRGAEAGQHVHVDVCVDGRWLRRTWTISSSADDANLQLTIQAIDGGRVTSWVHERLRVGALVKLSAASGDFVLPADGGPVVFLAGGVGITPALAMLRTMRDRGDQRPFVLVHYVRSLEYAIASEDLRALHRALPQLRVTVIPTDRHRDDAPTLIHAEQLRALDLTDALDTATWLACGPSGFMDAARDAVAALSPTLTLRVERFTPAPRVAAGEGGHVHFTRTARDGTNLPTQTLLEAAEAAGLQPKHGCRAGICFECACVKRSGVVVDLRTGERLTEDNQVIQLCVTQAAGDVRIDI